MAFSGLSNDAFATLQSLVLPDGWQTDAVQALKASQDVIVDAPTGAGKTYVFEKYFESANLNRQAVYTVPTRALANDKFAEWRNRGWRVGIATGDLAVDTEAPLLVATLEAVQGIAYRAQQPAIVVIDEYQWLADESRGNHYEGVIYSLPKSVRLLLLSGSVENPQVAAEWMERLGREVKVVRTKERPVPLMEYDVDSLARSVPSSIEGFWCKRLAGTLKEDMGPVLVFSPHRADAERLARQASRQLPVVHPLKLSEEQSRLAGSALSSLLEKRIAYHHSGLTYAQRAGLIEPLAKAGQLRLVFATLGLSAGINFSLRSVLITEMHYMRDNVRVQIEPHELLQMIGRAGRRGLDDEGFYLYSQRSPRKNDARPMRLRRARALPWAFFLRDLVAGQSLFEAGQRFSKGLFQKDPLNIGLDDSPQKAENFPCGNINKTVRARLVRRKRRTFKLCKTCQQREDCLQLDPSPTLIWQWIRLGLLERDLVLTQRGRIVSFFLGSEGLAIAAALEQEDYILDEMIFDLANLFGGERFCHSESRWGGRLALVCQKTYKRFSVEGYLQWGVPPEYGAGASALVQKMYFEDKRRGQLTSEHSGVGDIDRLLTEWRSLLRQIIQAPDLENERWQLFKNKCQYWLNTDLTPSAPQYPQLTAEQLKSISHRLRWRY